MRFNFKKIAAIGTSVLLTGMSMGFAAAAYPAPFVQSGVANVGVVYGTGAGVDYLFDMAGGTSPITTSLQSYMGASAGGTTATTSGETVALFANDKIWLNTSLTAGSLQTIGKSSLPTVLADSTFSGNVDVDLTSTIKLVAGVAAGGDNSGKVIFTKQPSTSDDPAVGISMGSSATSGALYNASVTMSAVNFSDSASEGETITLFGRDFVISTETTATNLVLFKSAQEVTLTVGGSNPSPSQTVNIGGVDYAITLTNGDSTTAYLTVNGDSKSVAEGSSKKIGGVDIAVKDVVAGSDTIGTTATLLIGAEKLTFTSGTTVTSGSSNDPIDGTLVYLVGTPAALTELAVTVFAPETQMDFIGEGESFVDPVFGSFKVDFPGLTSPVNDAGRETIAVNGGQQTATLTMTDSDANTREFDFIYNGTFVNPTTQPVKKIANYRLADSNNFSIFSYEGANLSENRYLVVGNEDYGHLVQVTRIYNDTGTTPGSGDKVWLEDVLSPTTKFEATFSAEGVGTIPIDGKTYTVTMLGSGDTGYAQVKYPTSDSSTANTWVIYPTIETGNGALVALYEPLNISLVSFNGTAGATSLVLNFPDGDGYTPATISYAGTGGLNIWNVVVGTTTTSLNTSAVDAENNYTAITIGEFRYNVSSRSSGGANRTTINLIDPEGNATLAEPGVMILEGKDKNSKYHGLVIDMETAPAGSSSDPLGVDDVLFTQFGEEYYSGDKALSGTDFTKNMDYFGTIATIDAGTASQKEATISIPSQQVYAQLYVGSVDSTVVGGTTSGGSAQLGNVLYKDTEVSSASTKNLIIVGGSCINSAAAALVGGPKCDADWTTATGVGSGQFLIQSFGSSEQSLTSGIALLVAGYEGTQTVNAATYLTTQRPDVSAGKKWIGTSSTSATLQTSEAA